MQETNNEPNTLIRTFVTNVIHQSFHHAIKQIGLPDFPRQTFLLELGISHSTLEHDFPEDRLSLLKLWQSIRQGEIIATEVWDEAPVFYVRGALGSMGVVLRLIFQEGEWHVESVISTYHRPLLQTRWFRGAMVTCLIILAAIVGFSLHHPTNGVGNSDNPSAAVLSASPNSLGTAGNSSASKGKGDSAGAKGNTAHSTISTHTSGSSHGIKSTKSTAKTPKTTTKTYAYTVTLGMPLYNLAQYLYDNHLVADAMTFDLAMKQAGIDLDIRPGRYVFRKGMSSAQLLSVLKNGPS